MVGFVRIDCLGKRGVQEYAGTAVREAAEAVVGKPDLGRLLRVKGLRAARGCDYRVLGPALHLEPRPALGLDVYALGAPVAEELGREAGPGVVGLEGVGA